MARPKHDDPDRFTGGEVADASGLSVRAIQFLRDKELGPFAHRDKTGGTYGEDTLAEVAMIAGCTRAGYGLTPAAALVTAFIDENSGHAPARFCHIEGIAAEIQPARNEWRRGRSWFHRFCLLSEIAPSPLTSVRDFDLALFVADREFVLTGTRGPRVAHTVVEDGIDRSGPFALGRMHDLKRGGEPEFVPFWQELGKALPNSPEATAAEIAYQSASKDALALVVINLSLSIRRAFETVRRSRIAKRGPYWTKDANQ